MDEPTALLPPVSTSSLAELLEQGPLDLPKGLELLGIIAGQLAKLHAATKSHGRLTADLIRVQTFESGPPVVIFLDPESTRDTTEGADQLALGVLAFQVLAGHEPTESESLRDALPDAPPALEKLVAKLMAARPADRLSAAGAQRQFLDLSASLLDPRSKTASVLAAPPQIKRGVPLGMQPTDARARVPTEATPAPDEPNPFAEDEKTARMPPRATAPDPRQGPALEDEPTQFAPVKWDKRQKPAERGEPLAPPVPTPGPMEAVEETRSVFEPSRSDLPGNTGEKMPDPRLAPRKVRRRNPDEHSPMSEFLNVAKKQPAWVWGAVGVGLAFFVLLLIALAR